MKGIIGSSDIEEVKWSIYTNLLSKNKTSVDWNACQGKHWVHPWNSSFKVNQWLGDFRNGFKNCISKYMIQIQFAVSW